MGRRLLSASLALGPLVIVLHYLRTSARSAEFVLAALALIPLAWLIGEATEHASHHTGAGVGGFLNATFGNAPELIIALIAVNEGLTEVVRGSLTGSVVGNLLLVLGFSLALGGTGESTARRASPRSGSSRSRSSRSSSRRFPAGTAIRIVTRSPFSRCRSRSRCSLSTSA